MEDSIKDYADRIFENEGNEQQIILTKEEFTQYLRTAAEQYGDAGRDENEVKLPRRIAGPTTTDQAKAAEVLTEHIEDLQRLIPIFKDHNMNGTAGEVQTAVAELTAILPALQGPKTIRVQVSRQDNLEGGFAAYLAPSLTFDGTAQVLLNIEATFHDAAANQEDPVHLVIEHVMHEVGHALQEFFGREFNEEEVEAIVMKYRERYGITEPKQTELTFRQLRKINIARCEKAFHPVAGWSPAEWATAFAGEAGEVCNAVKKLRRIQDGTNTAKDPQTVAEAIVLIGKELADTIIYADLLGARLGIDPQNIVIDKFNEVSDRMNCDIKLPAADERNCEKVMPSTDELRRTAEVLNDVMLHLEPKDGVPEPAKEEKP